MNERERPDPDALLASIQHSEEESRKGKLKIFLGMAAGVGKTYAMLKAGQALQAHGSTVVVGIVETHGRKETEALLEGLTIIPRVSVTYRNINVEEMDIDTLLKRKPEYVLVDELAHTNVEGMRHKKRYQDILELLDNGSNVYTTLNIQHIESLIDTVKQISGSVVYETVPDSFLDEANEIELIDLAPDVLLQRLAEGKVYTGERSTVAIANFFRKGNLTALREIALRKAAERVNVQLKTYMSEHRIEGPWKSFERLMVAVGPSPYSEQLIRWTKRIAATMDAPWIAVCVHTMQPLSPESEARLKKNIALAQELGATLIVTTDDNVVDALIRTAKQNNVTQIVIGKSLTSPLRDLMTGGSLVNKLINASGAIDIYVVQSDATIQKKKSRFFSIGSQRSLPRQYCIAGSVVLLSACACYFSSSILDYRSVGMVLLFVVTTLSLFVGRGPIIVTAILSALIWDFVFIPPHFTLHIGNPSDILLVLLYFIVAIVSGTLTARIRNHEVAARDREYTSRSLYRLVSELSSVENVDEIVRFGISTINAAFHVSTSLYVCGVAGDALPQMPHPLSTFNNNTEKERSVAEWVFRNKKPAGQGTGTLPYAEARYYPLLSQENCLGVIGLARTSSNDLTFDQEGLLQMYINQISLSIDRVNLRADRLSKPLLNSISHELRTPLATITGASGSLLNPATVNNPVTRDILLHDINAAAQRLNRLVGNLLDMSRIESGALKPALDWCDVHDIVGSVLANLHNVLAHHHIETTVAQDMPLIKVDAVLIEQAISNIIFNAVLYTPENTTIFLNAYVETANVIFSIEDEGKGFSPETMPHLFDKFYRIPGTQSGGTGLGLSIVKGFVEAHGGLVEVFNCPGKGAKFIIKLPVEQKTFSIDEAS
jgi:two-component system, OmpR family, sensor histidine kinase KdpD